MIVVLFDIDGTLIRTGGAGGKALMGAFTELFEISNPASVPFSGRTDRGIASDLFAAHHIADTDEHWETLRQGYLRRLPEVLPQCTGEILPGVERLLEHLSASEEFCIGLLTGNTHLGARTKLDHFGLFEHFPFGGFGDEHRDRDDVARVAHDHAKSRVGERFASERVWVIGDTPADVQCARAISAKVVAVTTGIHSKHELQATDPDLLLDDLTDLERLTRSFEGTGRPAH